MPWKDNTWIDDDGSLTVGTEFDAEHMNNIELGIAEGLGMAGSAMVVGGSALAAAASALTRSGSALTAAGSALVTGQFAGTLGGSALVTGQQGNARAASGVTAAGSGVTGVTNIDNLLAKTGVGVVVHAGSANVQRPSGFKQVVWIGDIEPEHADSNDLITYRDVSAVHVPAARGLSTGTLALPKATATQVTFQTTSYDNSGIHLVSGGIFTAPRTGIYLLNFNGTISALSTSTNVLSEIRVNNVAVSSERYPVASEAAAISHTAAVRLNGGDEVIVILTQPTGNPATLATAASFAVQWLGTGTRLNAPVDWGKVTVLPPAPEVGDTCRYKAAAGTYWHLEYTAEDATYPWNKIGGPPLIGDSGGAVQELTAEAFAELTGSNVTAPLKGEYIIQHGAFTQLFGASASNLIIGLKIGSAAVTEEPSAKNTEISQFAGTSIVSPPTPVTIAAAATVIKQYGKGFSAAVLWFYSFKWISIDPRKVG